MRHLFRGNEFVWKNIAILVAIAAIFVGNEKKIGKMNNCVAIVAILRKINYFVAIVAIFA